MTTSKIALFGIATAFAAVLTFTVPSLASAQVANDLKCKGCVGKKDIGKKAVRPKHIKKNAIKSKHIRDGAVQTEAMQDGAVTAAKLADSAKPTGGDHAESTDVYALAPPYQAVVTTAVTAPGPGFIIAIANWTYTATSGNVFGNCYLATAPEISDGPGAPANSPLGAMVYYNGASISRMFEVPAGVTTLYLNCYGQATMSVTQPQLTAFFVPNRY
jgi:hypothetical protein